MYTISGTRGVSGQRTQQKDDFNRTRVPVPVRVQSIIAPPFKRHGAVFFYFFVRFSYLSCFPPPTPRRQPFRHLSFFFARTPVFTRITNYFLPLLRNSRPRDRWTLFGRKLTNCDCFTHVRTFILIPSHNVTKTVARPWIFERPEGVLTHCGVGREGISNENPVSSHSQHSIKHLLT